jgi:hypothetical protein
MGGNGRSPGRGAKCGLPPRRVTLAKLVRVKMTKKGLSFGGSLAACAQAEFAEFLADPGSHGR